MTARNPPPAFGAMAGDPVVAELAQDLRWALSRYWSLAADVLGNSGIRLLDPPSGYDSLERNFFSFLFLYSYYRAGIDRERRTLYAGINQCLRGLVTGCDNLLDDEYKETLATDLPPDGVRFRSVLDMLVSDRVLYGLLIDAWDRGRLSGDQVRKAGNVSLRALTPSGAQEASEESGIPGRISPQAVLRTVHHLKTGLLFQAPWAVPLAIERVAPDTVDPLLGALHRIGMGCQIIDDMVDVASDLRLGRHNYVLSLIHDGTTPEAWRRFTADAGQKTGSGDDPLDRFPDARGTAAAKARQYLSDGLGDLFSLDHRAYVAPAIGFLAKRIGGARFPELADP